MLPICSLQNSTVSSHGQSNNSSHKINQAWYGCSNRAATHLALQLWEEALRDAERARVLAEAALKRNPKWAAPAYAKTFAQKGAALLGKTHKLMTF